jgi:hypothetical protein
MTFNSLGDLARQFAGRFSRFQLGYARGYALVMFVGVVVVLAFFFVVR